MRAVDLFAGAGGWDHGARTLGLDPVGLELDGDACKSRALSDLPTIRCDIGTYPAERFAGCDGLIASPPCQSFSIAGNGKGLDDPRGELVWQVPRWVDAISPRWVACEQVPPVLPIWQHIAHMLRDRGYRTWCGILGAETFGVPQTRRRAILLAHRDRAVHPPEPTHQSYVSGEPAQMVPGGMFTADLLPWVSMADALGWSDEMALEHVRGAGMVERYGERDPRPATEPAITMTEKGRSMRVLADRLPNGANRRSDEPAPTITSSLDNGDKRWTLGTRCGYDGEEITREQDEPAPTMTGKSGGQWQKRTTDEPTRLESTRLTLAEGLTLQGFDPDLPLAGTATSKWKQIGNAIPPPMAAAILRAVVA